MSDGAFKGFCLYGSGARPHPNGVNGANGAPTVLLRVRAQFLFVFRNGHGKGALVGAKSICFSSLVSSIGEKDLCP